MLHSYAWNGGSGYWSAPGNWDDLTILKDPALSAPGSGDTVSITGAPFPTLLMIGGPGIAQAVTATGDMALYGNLIVGSISVVGQPSAQPGNNAPGTLDIEAGAVLSPGTIQADVLQVAGSGAVLNVGGSLSVNQSLVLADSANVTTPALTFGTADLNGNIGVLRISRTATLDVYGGALTIAGGTVSIAGVLEVGDSNVAAPGTLTVDAGDTADIDTTIQAPIALYGELRGLDPLFPNAISGTGTIITSSAATFLAPVAAGITVVMQGARLSLPSTGFAATIESFQDGGNSALVVARDDIAGATTNAVNAEGGTSDGTLTLTGAGGATLETFTLTDAALLNPDFAVLPAVGTGLGGTEIMPAGVVLTSGTIGTIGIGNVTVITGVVSADSLAIGANTGGFLPSPNVIDVQRGGSLTANTVTEIAGQLVAGAGAAFTVLGTISLGMITAELDGFGPENFVGSQSGLVLTNGASGQSDATIFLDSNNAVIAVDARSRLEVGTAGGAATGALTIDRNLPVIGTGTIAADVVNNGSVIASATTSSLGPIVNALIVTGAITGAGQDQIATNSDLVLDGNVGAGQTIAFTGANATLDLSAGTSIAAAITGFAVGDTILAPTGVAGVSYNAAGDALTLDNASGTAVRTLTLDGGYAGQSFIVSPDGSEAAITLVDGTLQAGTPPAPSAGTDGDAYSWAADGGAWGIAGNWTNTTVGGTATLAPGSLDNVTIPGGPNGVISGSGQANQLTIKGAAVFSGTFDTALLNQGVSLASFTDQIEAGTTLLAGNTTLQAQLDITGPGALFQVSGGLSLQDSTNVVLPTIIPAIAVSDGGWLEADDLAGLGQNNEGLTSANISTYDVAVDATSTFEVGGAGRAAAGFLTVDAGAAIDGGLDTDAPIINNGTIINPAELDGAVSNDGTISGGGTIDGAISGTGTIQVGIGTPLLLNGGVGNGQTLDFLGVDAALSMPVTSRPALIRDFGTLDVLTITGAAIDAASWVYGTPSLGTLDLWQDGTVVDTLPIAGQYPGISFLTNPDRTAGTDIVMVVGTAPVYGQLSWAASLPGNWGDAGNWTVDSGGDTAPGAFDNAIIGQPEHYVATVAGTQSVHNLTLDGAGALLDVIGTFNVGGTLLDQAGTFVVAGGGELVGGTYILGAGAIPITGNGGTLDGTTWQGTLDIATTSTLDFINGLTLQGSGGVGPGAMVMAFSSSTAIVLHILDGETWDNASLTLSSATIDGIAGASLTLGPDFSAAIFWINFVDDQTVSFNLPVTNNGTLFTNDQLLNFASTLDNTGTIGVNEYAGHLSVLDLSNTGQISVGQYDDETLNVAGNVQGAGTLSILAGNVTVGGTIAAGQDIRMNAGGAGGQGNLTAAAIDPGATIAGFKSGETIDLTGVEFGPNVNAYWSGTPAGGTLSIKNGATTEAMLHLTGIANGATFDVASDQGAGTPGTNITTDNPAPCFAAGTRIRTPSGETPVEELRAGGRVVTAAGDSAEIIWLGHRTLDCRGHPRPQDVLPVRIQAGAFARNRPARDLVLSPDHAVFLGGVLIPVRYLINGGSIRQEQAARITYFHVELARHDVILAENLPCETYLDTGNRGAFGNGGAATVLHPDFARAVWAAEAYAELVLQGPRLRAARRRVLRRARSLGYTIAHDAALRLRVGAQCIAPRLVAGGLHRFAIPAGAVEATILSRAGVPAEIEAGGRDHRRLGVMVEHIVLRRPGWRRHVRLDLLPEGQGWHAAEREGARQWRWTDGRARLDLAGAAADGRLLLDLHIGAVQPSWRQRGTDDVGFGNGVDHRRAS